MKVWQSHASVHRFNVKSVYRYSILDVLSFIRRLFC